MPKYGVDLPYRTVLVMGTYWIAQTLLTFGLFLRPLVDPIYY